MKEFKTKSELYAEYVRLKEKYEPEPITEKKEPVKKPVRKKIKKKTVIKKPVIEKKEENNIWSKEAYELEKENLKRRRRNWELQSVEENGYEFWKKRKIELELHGTRCAKCNKAFNMDSYAPLCPDCYEDFGYYRIKGNEENFKKFLGKDAEIELQLPKGKCLIRL